MPLTIPQTLRGLSPSCCSQLSTWEFCASLCSHDLPVVVSLLPVAPRSPYPDSVPRPLPFHPCSGWTLCKGALTIPPPWHPKLPTCPIAPRVAFETTVQAPVNREVQTEEAPFAFSAEGLPHLPAPSRSDPQPLPWPRVEAATAQSRSRFVQPKLEAQHDLSNSEPACSGKGRRARPELV